MNPTLKPRGYYPYVAQCNCAAAMQGMPEAIQLRRIGHFTKADSAYGQGVAERRGLVPKLQAYRVVDFPPSPTGLR